MVGIVIMIVKAALGIVPIVLGVSLLRLQLETLQEWVQHNLSQHDMEVSPGLLTAIKFFAGGCILFGLAISYVFLIHPYIGGSE